MDTALAEAAVAAWREVDASISAGDCNGIPVLWAPLPGPLQAHLVFRVGRADEPFARCGISHMVEHLTLSALGEVPYRMNGAVTGDLTSFMVEGDESDVVAFLDHVCRTLHALPRERFEAERTVLRTEAARRTPDITAGLLYARYGPTGWGLMEAEEHALRAATVDEVQAWADRHYVAGNAALVLSGPPPAGLRLDLPAGPRLPLTPSRPVQQPLPTFVHRSSRVAGTGVVLPRSSTARALLRHGQRRFTQRLRGDQGVTYDVNGTWLRVAPGTIHATFCADTLADKATEVCSTMLDELDRLALGGPSEAELARDVEQMRRAAQRPEAAMATAVQRAVDMLHDESPAPAAAGAEKVVRLTPADVADAARQARDSSIWIVPNEATLPAWYFRDYVAWSSERVDGETYLPRAEPTGDMEPHSLVLGERGASLVLARQRYVTVPWDECVGMLSWSTGERVIFSTEGFRLLVDPAKWERASEIRSAFDSRVPAADVVPMGALEKPAAPAKPAAAAGSAARTRSPRALVRSPGFLLRLAVPFLTLAVVWWTQVGTASPPPPVSNPSFGAQPITILEPDGRTVTIGGDSSSAPAPAPSGGHLDVGSLMLAAVFSAAGGVALGAAVVRLRQRRRATSAKAA